MTITQENVNKWMEKGNHMTPFQRQLREMGACASAREWVGDRTAASAWGECEEPGWMLWYAEKKGVPKLSFVGIAIEAARMVLPLVPDGEDRPQLAIEATERWLAEPTEENRAASRAGARAAEAAAGVAEAWAAAWVAVAWAEAWVAVEAAMEAAWARAVAWARAATWARAAAAAAVPEVAWARATARAASRAAAAINKELCEMIRREITL